LSVKGAVPPLLGVPVVGVVVEEIVLDGARFSFVFFVPGVVFEESLD
jgi:hypothetical protein